MNVNRVGPTLVVISERPHFAVGRSRSAALQSTPFFADFIEDSFVYVPAFTRPVKSKFKVVREFSEVVPNTFEVFLFKDVCQIGRQIGIETKRGRHRP